MLRWQSSWLLVPVPSPAISAPSTTSSASPREPLRHAKPSTFGSYNSASSPGQQAASRFFCAQINHSGRFEGLIRVKNVVQALDKLDGGVDRSGTCHGFSQFPSHAFLLTRLCSDAHEKRVGGRKVVALLPGKNDLVLFDALYSGNGFLESVWIEQGPVELDQLKHAYRIGDKTRPLSPAMRADLMADRRQVADGKA